MITPRTVASLGKRKPSNRTLIAEHHCPVIHPSGKSMPPTVLLAVAQLHPFYPDALQTLCTAMAIDKSA
jgi:hypothetical protein